MEKMIEFWLYYFLKLHIQTRTRLGKIEANETRLSEIFHPRRDNLQNVVRDREETESLGTFSLETETLAKR